MDVPRRDIGDPGEVAVSATDLSEMRGCVPASDLSVSRVTLAQSPVLTCDSVAAKTRAGTVTEVVLDPPASLSPVPSAVRAHGSCPERIWAGGWILEVEVQVSEMKDISFLPDKEVWTVGRRELGHMLERVG
jgi:hypothetical protein